MFCNNNPTVIVNILIPEPLLRVKDLGYSICQVLGTDTCDLQVFSGRETHLDLVTQQVEDVHRKHINISISNHLKALSFLR